ncbi:substrate-binding periplasmic protein [Undibacterium sp. Xuan67W]|uniref:substrate-binding periplasmic protein n=1 Tax=Undibacterium sp. Xuan67W TaxID=3413057 RepID=UPI003BF363C5
MRQRFLPGLPLIAALVLGAGSHVSHAADCSRTVNVPVSATGQSVTINGDVIGGIYPDILRSIKEGCTFVLTPVPRARLELMFETGKADLLIPASKTPRRDEFGIFIPLVYNRATLISIDPTRLPIKTAQELLDRRDIKVAAVRGYDYGPAYLDLLKELGKQGRLAMEADPLSVARILKSGVVDVVIMAPSILAGVIMSDGRVQDMLEKLRFEPINELPWGGQRRVYIKNITQRRGQSGAKRHSRTCSKIRRGLERLSTLLPASDIKRKHQATLIKS